MPDRPPEPENLHEPLTEDVDEVLGSANPNPDRVGCPAPSVLSALASRELPISDPGYRHLAQCSPCYCEFREMRRRRRAHQPPSQPGGSGG
jgi:hypothetical protein